MGSIRSIRKLRRNLESKLGNTKYGPPKTWTDDELREFAELQRYVHEEVFGLKKEQREQLIQTINPTLLERMRGLELFCDVYG